MILHSTRSGRWDETRLEHEYQLVISYFMSLNTPASAHRVIGYAESQHAQVVDDSLIAWHARGDNVAWLGIEFTQPLPTDPFSQWQYDVGVAVVKAWAEKYKFPLDRWHVRRHQDTQQGQQDGKSDPGECFGYESFLNRIIP